MTIAHDLRHIAKTARLHASQAATLDRAAGVLEERAPKPTPTGRAVLDLGPDARHDLKNGIGSRLGDLDRAMFALREAFGEDCEHGAPDHRRKLEGCKAERLRLLALTDALDGGATRIEK